MPLRDDLLEPVAGDNPSGRNLQYDAVFDQIREAGKEDDDTLPLGDLDRPAKKADHRLVVKLAGEALAKRSKDLRLAAFLIESQFKLERLPVLAPSLRLLRDLQEKFWPTLYPEIEEGDLTLRVNAVERASKRLAVLLPELSLTANGLSLAKYRESRAVGYEADATTEERQRARRFAIDQKKITAEEFDRALATTPKAFLVAMDEALQESLHQANLLDEFQRKTYGLEYPLLEPLIVALKDAGALVASLLVGRRKVEHDSPAAAPPSAEGIRPPLEIVRPGRAAAVAPYELLAQQTVPVADFLSEPQDAYALILSGAETLFHADPHSPVPYLVCAALRLGETRRQDASPEPGFAVAPMPQVRQELRALALRESWTDLLRTALPVLADPCARAWLDLHRYIWRAAGGCGAPALASAVTGTLRELLRARPELRDWTLEDDTGAANPETRAWIDAEVLRES
jgi:type VI secretion system protein ImpA